MNRYRRQSCFDLFYEADSLFDPYCADAQDAVPVRAHANRALSPTCLRIATARNVHAGISAVTNHDENAASCGSEEQEEEEFIPGNSSSDDDDNGAMRPAIRRRRSN